MLPFKREAADRRVFRVYWLPSPPISVSSSLFPSFNLLSSLLLVTAGQGGVRNAFRVQDCLEGECWKCKTGCGCRTDKPVLRALSRNVPDTSTRRAPLKYASSSFQACCRMQVCCMLGAMGIPPPLTSSFSYAFICPVLTNGYHQIETLETSMHRVLK